MRQHVKLLLLPLRKSVEGRREKLSEDARRRKRERMSGKGERGRRKKKSGPASKPSTNLDGRREKSNAEKRKKKRSACDVRRSVHLKSCDRVSLKPRQSGNVNNSSSAQEMRSAARRERSGGEIAARSRRGRLRDLLDVPLELLAAANEAEQVAHLR